MKKTSITILAIFCALFICGQCFVFSALADEYDKMAIAQEEPQFGTGHLPEPIEPTYIEPPLISTYSILPSSVDLSADMYFPDIVSQGSYGACSSYATTYYQFTYAAARLNNWAMKGNDIDRRFSPRYTYNFCNNGADSGSSLVDNIYVLQQAGSVKMSEFNLNPNQYNVTLIRQWCTDTNAVRNALNTRVSDYAYERFAELGASRPISDYNSPNLTNMKTLLNNGHILTFSTYINGWDTVLTSNGSVTVKAVASPGSHAMSIVGYDDNISYDLNQNSRIDNFEKGAFKIANSWGPYWENNGFVWLMYDALNESSNASIQNVSGRIAALDNYAYFWVSAENYVPKLTVEATLMSVRKNDITCSLGYMDQTGVKTLSTHVENAGGPYGFDGSSQQYSECTLVFDFEEVIDALGDDWESKNIFIEIADTRNNGYITTVKNITFKKDGINAQSYTPNYQLDGRSQRYFLNSSNLPSNITVSPSARSLTGPYTTYTLSAAVSPSGANDAVTWSSSNPAVVLVNSYGVIMAVGEGNATITATTANNGLTDTCEVSVAYSGVNPTSLSLNSYSVTLAPGETFQYKATLSPAGAYGRIFWSTNSNYYPPYVKDYFTGLLDMPVNPYITIDDSGLVTAIKDGSAMIYVYTVNGIMTPSYVTVKSVSPTKITLNPSNATIFSGEELQLTATISPANATDKSVKWSSNNSSAATVDSNGVVKGISAGTATITAATVNGFKATCSITVVENTLPTSIEFTQTSYEAEIPTSGSSSITVTAQVKDQNGNNMSDRVVTYSIGQDNHGVTINSTTGVVTIPSTATPGTVTLIASHGNLSTTAPLELTSSVINPSYTLHFDYPEDYDSWEWYINHPWDSWDWDEWDDLDGWFYVQGSRGTLCTVSAYVLDEYLNVVDDPEIVIEYTLISAWTYDNITNIYITNTTGEFDTLDMFYEFNTIFARAYLPDGTILETHGHIYFDHIK